MISKCFGHEDSTVAASLSLNSTKFATGDLNGYMQVRDITKGIRVFDSELDEVYWILWYNTSDSVLLAGIAKVEFLDVESER